MSPILRRRTARPLVGGLPLARRRLGGLFDASILAALGLAVAPERQTRDDDEPAEDDDEKQQQCPGDGPGVRRALDGGERGDRARRVDEQRYEGGFTPDRAGRAVRAGVAAVLNGLTGIVIWLA
jgi:hypothetical protein